MHSKAKKATLKTFVSFMFVIMFITSFYSPVSASSQLKTFIVRRSTDYSACGVVKMKTKSNTANAGTFEFTCDTSFYSDFLHTWVTFEEGTKYNYKISSMKDGKKITLTYDPESGGPGTDEVMDNWGFNIRSFSGKIHMSGSNSFSHISKIDCFYGNNTSNKIGFYFREN